MKDDIQSGCEIFKAEALELTSGLVNMLLELEEFPNERQLIDSVFRALHTIKGSGAMFGFDRLSAFSHMLENAYDLVRNGKLGVSKMLIDVTLSAVDHINELLSLDDLSSPERDLREKEILDRLISLMPCEEPVSPPLSAPGSGGNMQKDVSTGPEEIYRIRFNPGLGIMTSGVNPLLLIRELKCLGDCEVFAFTRNIPMLDDYDSEACYTCWDIILHTDRGIDAVKDVFIFVEDKSEINIDLIAGSSEFTGDTSYKKLGEILIERNDVSAEELRKVLSSKKLIGEILVEHGIVSNEKVQSALIEQTRLRESLQKYHASDIESSIRVASDKLDKLVDLVGELVTVQARLSQTSAEVSNPTLTIISEEVERLTQELRESAMNMRMVPIGTMFSKFRRLVRDLSSTMNKQVELRTEGADTELDKNFIDKLGDPLMHIIRNSIDHGIESPEARIASGKPATGTITLSASHSGQNILIAIKDDGNGLDASKIRKKAIEKGLIQSEDKMSEKEFTSLILLPGFSTSGEVTSVSGRGVGMDVVNKSVSELKGQMEIMSENGLGTTIMLRLPLTLAIIDGLIVRVSSGLFIIPLSRVEECVELKSGFKHGDQGRTLTDVRGRIVPYIRLRERFGINEGLPSTEKIVVVNSDGGRVGLAVDEIIGEYQTVLKSLGKFYNGMNEVSGATIMGDGTVAMVLDVPILVKEIQREEECRIS